MSLDPLVQELVGQSEFSHLQISLCSTTGSYLACGFRAARASELAGTTIKQDIYKTAVHGSLLFKLWIVASYRNRSILPYGRTRDR
jgi:hypothetical protein